MPVQPIPGLKMPAAPGILLESFKAEEAYLLFLATELARLLLELRSELLAKPIEVLAPSGLILPPRRPTERP